MWRVVLACKSNKDVSTIYRDKLTGMYSTDPLLLFWYRIAFIRLCMYNAVRYNGTKMSRLTYQRDETRFSSDRDTSRRNSCLQVVDRRRRITRRFCAVRWAADTFSTFQEIFGARELFKITKFRLLIKWTRDETVPSKELPKTQPKWNGTKISTSRYDIFRLNLLVKFVFRTPSYELHLHGYGMFWLLNFLPLLRYGSKTCQPGEI